MNLAPLDKRIIGILIIWVVSFFIFHTRFSYQELSFKEFSSNLETNSDKSEQGISEVGVSQKGDTIGFWIELKPYPDGKRWPWADVKIRFDDFIDVSDYDFIEFDFKNSKINKIVFTVGVNYPDGSNLPFHALAQEALVDTNYSKVKLPFRDFKTRFWWLKNKVIEDIKFEDVNYNEFSFFAIGAGTRSIKNEREQMFIHSIKFTKYVFWPYYIFAGVLFLLLVLLIIRYVKNRIIKKKEREVVISYSVTPEEKIEPLPSVIDYIKENYHNPELSLQSISQTLKISETKISAEIKLTTSLTFKQYINDFRIEKAKKMLEESDIKISTISEMVGYDNVTNFNRVFKKLNNITPTEFRLNKELE